MLGSLRCTNSTFDKLRYPNPPPSSGLGAIAMFLKRIGGIAITVIYLSIAAALATPRPLCCSRGYVDAVTVAKVSAQLKHDMHSSGIQGVSTKDQQCYDNATTARAVSECMLYDISAFALDRGMMTVFISRGWNTTSLGASTTLLTPQAFHARTQIYGEEAFGSEEAANAYFGNASSKVLDDMNR
jgi:hypothetical protein